MISPPPLIILVVAPVVINPAVIFLLQTKYRLVFQKYQNFYGVKCKQIKFSPTAKLLEELPNRCFREQTSVQVQSSERLEVGRPGEGYKD